MLDLGDPIPGLTFTVTDSGGAPADATTTPVLTITRPDSTTVTPTVAHPATGVYTAAYTTTQYGTHGIRWVAGPPWPAVLEDTAEVTAYAPFISEAQALAHLRAAGTITSSPDQDQLRWLCLIACRAVERDLGRSISRQTIVEEHDSTKSALILRQTPVQSITSVACDGTTLDPTGYRVGLDGILRSRAGWQSGSWGIITVTYVAEMRPVPVVLQKIALNAVQRMWQTSQNAPHPAFGDSGGGGGDFAATAILSQLGRLTPVEYGAYLSYKSTGIA